MMYQNIQLANSGIRAATEDLNGSIQWKLEQIITEELSSFIIIVRSTLTIANALTQQHEPFQSRSG